MAPSNVVNIPGMVDSRRLIVRALAPAMGGEIVVSGKGGKPSPTATLEALAYEVMGWERLAREVGVAVSSADNLCTQAAQALGIGDQWRAIRASLSSEKMIPRQVKKAGREAAVNRLKREARKASTDAKPDDGPKKLKGAALIDFVREGFAVELDAWGGHISVNGEVLKKAEHFYLKLADEHNVEAGKEAAIDTIAYIAEQNKKDRVLDYLDSLSDIEPLGDEDWENIAGFVLGTTESFDNLAFRKGLIAAVARAKDPGCKVDECPVLQGPQGLRKSTALATLAGESNFNDRLSDFDNKDVFQELHSCWFHEIGEFDRITNKKDSADMKSFVSKSFDTFRAPYAKSPETFQRRCVLWGTVNPPIFLVDNTGNRRYPIIKVREVIDIEKLKAFRDRIWAKAILAYESGESWHYTTEETRLINQRAQEFMYEDSWEPDIANYLHERQETTLNDVLRSIGLEVGKVGGRETSRAAKILIGLGWEKGVRRREGSSFISPWIPPQGEAPTPQGEAPTPQGEAPTPPGTEPLPVKLAAEVEAITEAVEAGEFSPEFYQGSLSTEEKRQVFAALPTGIQAKIHNLKKTQKGVNTETASSAKPSYSEQ
jgi:predicted P-loop ATPase